MRYVIMVFATLLLASPVYAQSGWRDGWVPAAEVERAVQQLRTPLYQCYTAHVPAASRKHGDVATLRVVVSEAGSVFRVDFLEGSTRSKKFDGCLRKLFEGLSFATTPTEKTSFIQRLGFQNGSAKMLIEPPRAAGGAITKESVEELARAHHAQIDACYRTSLAANPNLRGQLLVEIIVDGARGSVTQARVVKATMQSPETEACVLSTVRSFVFPIPEQPDIVIVQFPLTFVDDQ